MTRKGKIARLPLGIRQQLNQRLADGQPGPRLVDWLNSIPEVQTTVANAFQGQPITKEKFCPRFLTPEERRRRGRKILGIWDPKEDLPPVTKAPPSIVNRKSSIVNRQS